MTFLPILLFATLLVALLLVLVGLAMKASTTQPKKPDHPAEHPTEDKKGGDKTDPHKKDGHEDDHAHAEGHGHAAGGHDDHHHGNPLATFLKEILGTWYIGIPLGIIFMYWIFGAETRQKFLGTYVEPVPNYMQFKVNADIVGTGLLSTYTVSAYGPDHCRFDSVFNDGMFFDWNPVNGEGTCGYYGGGTGKLKVESFTKPTPLTFLVMAKRQKQENKDEWEVVKLEGKSSL